MACMASALSHAALVSRGNVVAFDSIGTSGGGGSLRCCLSMDFLCLENQLQLTPVHLATGGFSLHNLQVKLPWASTLIRANIKPNSPDSDCEVISAHEEVEHIVDGHGRSQASVFASRLFKHATRA
jgi:hypothetical protein